MYDKNDPRSTLAHPSERRAPPVTRYFGAEYGHIYRDPPPIADASGRTWIIRAQAFVVAYSKAAAGGSFLREDQPDEYVVLGSAASTGAPPSG